jgi:hypothetical protein
MTRQERRVMRFISLAHKEFARLKQQHPSDISDFIQGVHVMQGLLMQRAARRSDPKSFPSYKTKVTLED